MTRERRERTAETPIDALLRKIGPQEEFKAPRRTHEVVPRLVYLEELLFR